MQSQLEGRVNGNQHCLQNKDQKSHSSSAKKSSSTQYTLRRKRAAHNPKFLTHVKVQFLKPEQ